MNTEEFGKRQVDGIPPVGEIASVGDNNDNSPRNILRKIQCFGTKTWINLREELKDQWIRELQKHSSFRNQSDFWGKMRLL